MAFSRDFVEYVLLGPINDRRQLQDSPLLGDVWTEFAAAPGKSFDLLITPVSQTSAGRVATVLDDQIGSDDPEADPNVAYVDSVVAATLDFTQLLRYVVPLTSWWHNEKNYRVLRRLVEEDLRKSLPDKVEVVLRYAQRWQQGDQDEPFETRLSAFDRYVALAGLILWAGTKKNGSLDEREESEKDYEKDLQEVEPEEIVACLSSVFRGKVVEHEGDHDDDDEPAGLIWQVAHNRAATPAIDRSVSAVKGDAARTLFSIDCSGLTWAVIDSGIDQSHPAFFDQNGKCRVVKAFDFSRFRSIVAVGNARPAIRKKNLQKLKSVDSLDLPGDADELLEELGEKARKGEPTDWNKIERLVRARSDSAPTSDHGTHVAGILGACANDPARDGSTQNVNGVCPDIRLYDFRILAPEIQDTEFAVIAALQYIRHLNERSRRIVVHGANLSLSIPHEVRNYACGRTPVCVECERLVDSGVVVVAAAGNQGYQQFQTVGGSFSGYAAFSITDPGNADGVITVGATHRYSPHTYGVSFFSSRGPTGDGRLKPDIVAPGERISGPVLDTEWGDHDGTSMAAPHVSGAAAMLLARYPELIGQPRRVKRILCENATDLGRERSFQGHGMLDILRALQSV